MPDWIAAELWLALAAMLAGAVNALAGGGTLLTFPALLAVVSPVLANGTSTVALVPGSLASAWGYRRELADVKRWAVLLLVPSVIGGIVGTLLVTRLPESYFMTLVPWLILAASVLFLLQPRVTRWIGASAAGAAPSRSRVLLVAFFQLGVAIYGGYFGAGIGILMLSALGLMGLGEIHHMNALKSVLGAGINGAAAAIFIADGMVAWQHALVMAVAAVLGGFLGAHYGRQVKPLYIRWFVIAIGFGLAGYYFVRQWSVAP